MKNKTPTKIKLAPKTMLHQSSSAHYNKTLASVEITSVIILVAMPTRSRQGLHSKVHCYCKSSHSGARHRRLTFWE